MADSLAVMTYARNLYPDTVLFVTSRCVHRSFRLVPTRAVRRVVDYCFAVVSSRYRQRWGMEFYEFEFLSNHYHVLLSNSGGKATDFVQDLNALLARALNAVRGEAGAFFERQPGIQTVLGEERLLDHCAYVLANAVAAGIVHKTAHWRGCNSLRLDYGQARVVEKPRIGLWAKKVDHRHRRSSQRSGRAAFAERSRLPESAVLELDRPPVRSELSDAELRAEVRARLVRREAWIAEQRSGKPVLGMKAALRIHWTALPERAEQLFGRQPTFSAQTAQLRAQMKRLRRAFLRQYADALARWNAGDPGVVFPAGTVRMRLRHRARTDATPLHQLLGT